MNTFSTNAKNEICWALGFRNVGSGPRENYADAIITYGNRCGRRWVRAATHTEIIKASHLPSGGIKIEDRFGNMSFVDIVEGDKVSTIRNGNPAEKVPTRLSTIIRDRASKIFPTLDAAIG